MSAGGSGAPSASSVNENLLLVLGIVGGLLGIYLSNLNVLGIAILNSNVTLGLILTIIGPVLACLGGVCAIVWGANAIRSVASYGLGTGVPSIGYMTLSIGVIGALAGLILATTYNFVTFGPIFCLIIALIVGCIVGLIGTKVIGMKIPVMVRCTTELGGAAALSVLAFASAIAGTFNINVVFSTVVSTGFIIVLLVMNTMALQHPYNACLGPNESQTRTLKCALNTAFLAMVVTGVLALISGGIAWFVILIIGLIGWVLSFRSFVNASCNDAASVKWTGLWPKVDE